MLFRSNAKRLRDMLKSRSAPRCLTDVEFFGDVGTLSKQYEGEEGYLNQIVSNAKSHGYSPNPHDFYMGNLARFPGDPEAFIPPTGGRGHLKKVLQKRGLPCSGAVEVAGREPIEDPWESIVTNADQQKLARENSIGKKKKVPRKHSRK